MIGNNRSQTPRNDQKISNSFINQLQYCKLDLCCFVQSDKLRWSFLMQPLKPNFNPKPTKLLQQEWMFQRHLERDTLLHLQKFGNFPVEIDLTTIDAAAEINMTATDAAQSTELNGEQPKNAYKSSNSKNPKKTKKKNFSTTTIRKWEQSIPNSTFI